MKILDRKFYADDTILTAQKLLGKLIVKNEKYGKVTSGVIVETEAYVGQYDEACHAFNKTTGRSRFLYPEGGVSYVYFIYGNYYCFNVVTEREGIGAAVLIRAVEPVDGTEIMKRRRKNAAKPEDLTNGPAKFCMAFGIGREHNQLDLTASESTIRIYDTGRKNFDIMQSKRIGIVKSAELPFRYFIKDNAYVTKHKLNTNAIKLIKKI